MIFVVVHGLSICVVFVGYNGMPRGCSDDLLPWHKRGASILETKYPFVCQAEMNAILNRNTASLKGCTIYVMQFPDSDSAKLIIQAGIKEVVFVSDEMHDALPYQASRRLLNLAGVTCRSVAGGSRQFSHSNPTEPFVAKK
eukprot:m.139815 g.139815  ORF g.139815 m.139815 type:complete len:141 (+) comp15957_c1_seq6:468-890(+)